MFNHGLRGRRGGDNSGITGLATAYNEAKSPQVTINGYFVTGTDDLALSTAGGQTITITGGGFATGITGTIGGVSIGAITFVNSTQITFTSPVKTGGLYVLVLTNSNGSTGALVPGVLYSSVPTFSTGTNVGTVYETVSYTKNITATSDSTVTYALTSGAFPPDATFNTSTGVLTGTVPSIANGSTTYNFTITATDAENQDVTQSFTLTESTDVLSWVTPANGATINLDGTAYSQALNATDAAGYGVSYTANALPTGLTLSAGTISGAPTAEGTISTLLTATAATTTRSQTNTITWVVSLGDLFFNTTTLLLSGGTSDITTTFINDASLNNNQLTIVGDTKPTNFTPYGDGYFSYKFDGASYALGMTPTNNTNFGTTIGTSDFCLEGWGYWTSFNFGTYGAPLISMLGQTAGELMIRATKTTANTTSANFFSILGAGTYIPSSMFSSGVSVGTLYLNRWHHLAIQRVSGTWYFYIDGVMLNSTSAGDASLTLPFTNYYIGSDGSNGGGYIAGNASNVRLSVGTVPYATAGFTVPTSPLTYLPTTKFLSAQSNRLIDNGPINCTFTTGGTANTGVQITPFTPFTKPSSMRVPTLYSTYFDGTSGYVYTSHNALLSMDSGNFSAECWCYRTCSVSGEAATLINKSGTGFVTVAQWGFGSSNGYWSYNIGNSGNTGNTFISVQTTTVVTAGVWHHVALIKTGTTYSMYVDGTRISTSTNATVPADNNPLGLSIGFQFAQTSTGYWWGQISDVRINKGTLPTGYDATQTTLTVPTSKLTAVTGTVLLTCQGNVLKDNSTNNFTISSVSPSRPHPVSPFTQTYNSVTGLTTLGSAYFDGTGDYLSVASSTDFSTANFTIEGWINPATGSVSPYLLTYQNGTATNANFAWMVALSNLALNVYAFNGTTAYTAATPVVTVNTWSHIAIVRNGTSLQAFLNGVGGTAVTIPASINNPAGSSHYFGSSATSPNYNGYMSDFRIVVGTALYTSNFLPPQQPLTATSNTRLLTCQYNGGANNYGIIDNSGWLNPLTRYGNATQGSFSPYSPNGWSNYFNGTTDYISLPTGFNTQLPGLAGNKVQIEMWVYPTNSAATSYSVGLFGTYAAIAANGRWYFGIDTNTTLTFAYTTSTGAQNNINATATCVANKWQHIAVTVDATTSASATISFYYNGTASTVSTGNNMSTQTASMGNPQISVNSSYVTLYTGFISNFRVLKNNFTITGAYTVPTGPFAATSDTLLLTSQSNKILDNSPYQLAFTLSGTPSVQAFSPFGGTTTTPNTYSNYFDGTGDYINSPAQSVQSNVTNLMYFPAGTDYTIECWVYVTAAVVNQELFGSYSGGTAGRWIVRMLGDGLTLSLYQYPSVVDASFTTPLTLRQWYHVALTRTGTTTRGFVNGTGVTLSTASFDLDGGTSGFYIGQAFSGRTPWNGYISNLRIVRGTSLYTSSTYTVPTGPLTAITNTTLLTCQSNNIVDNGPYNYFLTGNGDARPFTFNPFGQTTTNNVAYNPTIHGGSMYCDGTGDYLTAVNSKSFDLSIGQWTIECWFYQLAAKQVQLFSISAALWRLAVGSNGAAEFTFNTSSTMPAPAGSFSPGQWNHIAVSYDPSATTKCNLFVNGKQVSGGALVPNADTTSLFYIGNNKDAAGAWDFNGYITDVRITRGQCYYYTNFYPSLTPLPVNSNTVFMMNGVNGGVIDSHATNVLETYGSAQLVPEDPYQGSYYSNYFNGSSDGLTYTLPTGGTGNFTVEAWVFPVNTNRLWVIGSNNATQAYGITLESGLAHVWWNYLGNPTMDGNTAIILGQWVHLAMVREGTVIYLYVNGIKQTNTITGVSGTFGNSSSVSIGWWGAGPQYSNGYISNLRVVDGTALYTPTLYPSGFTPSTTPLTAVAGTKILTCQSNNFKDNSTGALAITITGTPAIRTVNPFKQNTGKGLSFPGGAYLAGKLDDVNFGFGLKDFTLEMWIYPTATNAFVFFDTRRQAESKINMGLGTSGAGMLVSISSSAVITTTTGVGLNRWTHVAVVKSSGTVNLYLNGVSAGSVANTTDLGTTGSFALGTAGDARGNASYDFKGYISDVRVTRGYARYTSNFTPTTTALKNK